MAEFNEIRTPDMNTPWEGEGPPPAVRKVLLAMVGAAIAVAVPYVLAVALPDGDVKEELAELRVWTSDNPLPFSRHFRTSGVGPATVVGGAGATGASILGDGDEGGPIEDLVAEVEVTPPPVVEPSGPAGAPADGDVPGAPPGDDSAPAKPAAPPPSPYAAIRIPPKAWQGLTTFIEDPEEVMAPFYEALADVALKREGAVARISHWGDSAIAADGMPSAVRRLLQITFGDGGHGYAMVSASTPWYRRKDVEWTSKGWKSEEFIRDQAADGHYGYGGVVSEGAPGAKATWKTVDGEDAKVGRAASRFEVHYQRHKRGGILQVSVDGAEVRRIDTRTEGDREEHVEVVEVPDGRHTFEIRNAGEGRVRVYGVVIERSSGVVYDGLGVVGARDTRWLNAAPEGIQWALKTRRPDLAILMYGGNALEDKTTMTWYKERLVEVVKRWKSGLGGRSCLVMTPIDHGERYRGKVRTVKRQVEMMAVQREVALAEGCAFFSIYEAMGGDGAIGRWFDEGLASGDLAHPTAKGSVELGRLFYQALMKGLHDWVAEAAAAPAVTP